MTECVRKVYFFPTEFVYTESLTRDLASSGAPILDVCLLLDCTSIRDKKSFNELDMKASDMGILFIQ